MFLCHVNPTQSRGTVLAANKQPIEKLFLEIKKGKHEDYRTKDDDSLWCTLNAGKKCKGDTTSW